MHKELVDNWKNGKFHHCWLIKHPDTEYIKEQVQKFIKENLHQNINTSDEYNPDLWVLNQTNNKEITVKDIRELQSWIYKSSCLSKYKAVIIVNADKMNNNASNCCLKIFEDTPKNTFIFLLAKTISNIPITIRSRCKTKLIKADELKVNTNEYNDFLSKLTSEKQILDYCITLKNNIESWQQFSNFILFFLSRWGKHKLQYINKYYPGEKILLSLYLPNISIIAITNVYSNVENKLQTAENLSLCYMNTSLTILLSLLKKLKI